jgi:pimeloyl-ACP methyl ester carboxylesterase
VGLDDRLDAARDHAGLEASGGGTRDLAPEDDLHAVGAPEIELVGDRALKPRPAGGGAIEDAGVGQLQLADRQAIAAERILLSDMSEPDRRLFGRPEYTGRFGADLAGAGSRGVVDNERVMPLPWGFEPERVEGPVRLWLGERDALVQAHVWLERPGQFPACETTVVPGAGHFFIAATMATIVSEV